MHNHRLDEADDHPVQDDVLRDRIGEIVKVPIVNGTVVPSAGIVEYDVTRRRAADTAEGHRSAGGVRGPRVRNGMVPHPRSPDNSSNGAMPSI
jgi:hypothetical protein